MNWRQRIVLICGIISSPAFSQNYEWVNFYKGGGVRINDIEYYNENSYLVGVFDSLDIDKTTLFAKGYVDIFVFKFQSSGGTDTVFSIGGVGLESPTDLEFDSNGNYILGGIYRWGATIGNVDLGVQNQYASNAFVTKFDSTGEFLWVVELRNENPQFDANIYDLEIDHEGNILVLSGSTSDSAYLTKISPSGEIVWENRHGFESAGGNIILFGETIIVFWYDLEGLNRVEKFDHSGNEIFTSRVLPTKGSINEVISDETGFILSLRQNENAVLREKIGIDGGNFIFKMDADFNFEWGSRIGENNNYNFIHISNLSKLQGKKTVVSGRLSGQSSYAFSVGELSVNTDSTSAFLAIVDSLGNFEWISTFGNSGSTIQEISLDTDSDGSIYFGNEMNGKAYFECVESSEESVLYFGKIDVGEKTPISIDSKVCSGDTIHFNVLKDQSLIAFDIQLGGVLEEEEFNLVGNNGYTISNRSGTGSIQISGTYESSCGDRYQAVKTLPVEVLPLVGKDLMIEGQEKICINQEVAYTVSQSGGNRVEWMVPDYMQVVYNSEDSIVVKIASEEFKTGDISALVTGMCDSLLLKKKVELSNDNILDSVQPTIRSGVACRSEPITITAPSISLATRYRWKIDYSLSGKTQLLETNDPEIKLIPEVSNVYNEVLQVSVKGINGCYAGPYGPRLDIDIVSTPKEGELIAPQRVCKGFDTEFSIVDSQYSNYQWVFENESGEINTLLDGSEITFSYSDDYKLTVYGTNECGTVLLDERDIKVVDEIEPAIFEDCEKLYTDETYETQWFLNGELISSTEEVLKEKSGKYMLQVQGLCSQIEVDYNVTVTKDYFIPNIFTPNDDGLNDSFTVPDELIGQPLKVISRAGEVVFISDSYQNDWGKVGSIKSGIYYYAIDTGCDFLRGYVTVLK